MSHYKTVRGRRYWDATGECWPTCQECEHCDGDKSSYVRIDRLRGHVCPVCDSALDEMFNETAVA